VNINDLVRETREESNFECRTGNFEQKNDKRDDASRLSDVKRRSNPYGSPPPARKPEESGLPFRVLCGSARPANYFIIRNSLFDIRNS